MRKLLVLIIAPILLITGLQAQTITQQEADALVLEKMSGETRPYSIYAKENIQQAGTVLTTSAGEIMVFDYEHWLYYVSFTDNLQDNNYFVVKESNGSLLEVNVKNDEGPEGLQTWRKLYGYPFEIPFTDYSFHEFTGGGGWMIWENNFDVEKLHTLFIFNNSEDFENYLTCPKCLNNNYPEIDYPEIDFSAHTLLYVWGACPRGISNINKQLFKVSENEYILDIKVINTLTWPVDEWSVLIMIPKLSENKEVILNILYSL